MPRTRRCVSKMRQLALRHDEENVPSQPATRKKKRGCLTRSPSSRPKPTKPAPSSRQSSQRPKGEGGSPRKLRPRHPRLRSAAYLQQHLQRSAASARTTPATALCSQLKEENNHFKEENYPCSTSDIVTQSQTTIDRRGATKLSLSRSATSTTSAVSSAAVAAPAPEPGPQPDDDGPGSEPEFGPSKTQNSNDNDTTTIADPVITDLEFRRLQAAHVAHVEAERQQWRNMEAQYRTTGDVSVFRDFLAPFAKQADSSSAKREIKWVWDRDVLRWKAEGVEGAGPSGVLWGPVLDGGGGVGRGFSAAAAGPVKQG